MSPISIWELLMLCRKGRITLQDAPEVWTARAMTAAPLREAPITYEVALETQKVELPHRDPADRFWAATARVFALTLVTSDEHLLRAKGFSVLANR